MRGLQACGWPALFLGLGLFVGHYPMLLSAFGLMEGGLGDARFINFMLEHGWQWVIGTPHHASLWSPPFFFPARNVGAYSDILIGSAPPYFLGRALGLGMDSAFQLWLLALDLLNFVSMYAFARKACGASCVPASVAGVLFAFGGVRLAQAGHYQLYPQFWTMLALLGFAVATGGGSSRRRNMAALLVGPCLALQFWTSFYLAWFFGLALMVTIPAALARRTLRLAAWRERRFAIPLFVGAVAGAALLWPVASHYRQAAATVGMRDFGEAMSMIPTPSTWFYMGRASLLYGQLASQPWFQGIPMEHEQRIGFGLFTSLLAATGLLLGRKQPWVFVCGVAAVGLLVVSTHVGEATAWRLVFDMVPGAGAIRGVSRICLAILIPVSLGVAVVLTRIERAVRQRGSHVAAALGLLCLAEQAQYLGSFDKQENRAAVRQISSQLDCKVCDAFFYSPLLPTLPEWKYQLDAMWASMQSGVPTVNGYSGNSPPGWELDDSSISSPEREAELQSSLSSWIDQNRLDRSRVCWVRQRPSAECSSTSCSRR